MAAGSPDGAWPPLPRLPCPSCHIANAAALLPHGALLTLPDSPHAAHYSTPDEFTAAILPFLHAHDGGTRDVEPSC